jgi:hypothetical protein
MTFRNSQKAAYFFIASVMLLMQFSCSEFLKGKATKNDVIEVKKENLNCIKDISKKWTSFLKSQTTEKEIDQVFTCLDSTLSEFQNRIEGRVEAQAFTTDELYQIFDKFLNDTKISKDATSDLLILKAAILGGSNEKITRKEIGDLRNYLLTLKTEAKALLPYAPLFRFKKDETTYSKKMLQDGFGQLKLSLKNLLKTSQLYRSDYQFSDLQRLITNLKILNQDQTELWGLAQKVKDLLAGTQAIQSESDYTLFIDNLSEVLRLYSLQVQGYIRFEIQEPDQMMDAIDFVQSWFNLFENSLQFKRSKIVASETIDPVLKEIHAKGLIPIDLKLETLLQFYKILTIRAFDSGIKGETESFSGFKKLHFINIKREVSIFKTYLNFLNSVSSAAAVKTFNGKDRISLADVQQKMKAYLPSSYSDFLQLDETNKSLVQKGFNDLKSEFLVERPVIYRFNKMVIAVNQEIWDQNWQDLARGLYNKMLARELLIGWGSLQAAQDLNTAFVTEAGLVQWYTDFKNFGVETKSFDPRAVNSGAVSFKQANLLTYSADGDDKMNFFESIQFLNMVISGGGQTLNEIQTGFKNANCNINEKDVFRNAWNDEKCSITDLRIHFKDYFSNLSYLVGFTSQLSDVEFTHFYYNVMDVTRIDAQFKGQKVETADLRTFSILLHYIESLFAKFDTNRNWKFSADEMRAAYPRFKSFAKKYAYDNSKAAINDFNGILAQTVGGYSCYSENDLIQESFVFLVYNGKAPSKSDLNNFPCFRSLPLIDFKGEVDRNKMINTFKILKSVIGS